MQNHITRTERIASWVKSWTRTRTAKANKKRPYYMSLLFNALIKKIIGLQVVFGWGLGELLWRHNQTTYTASQFASGYFCRMQVLLRLSLSCRHQCRLVVVLPWTAGPRRHVAGASCLYHGPRVFSGIFTEIRKQVTEVAVTWANVASDGVRFRNEALHRSF